MRTAALLRHTAAALLLAAAACAPKPAPAPPPAPQPVKQNVFALLPEPGRPTGAIVVSNQAGSQELTQPYQAVRVERAGVAPSAPFVLDPAEVTRLFGSALEVLPAPELPFVLHFDGDSDVLNAESEARFPAVLAAIRERRSTAISIIGHTDTVGAHDYNYRLGLRRANHVADRLKSQGVAEGDLFVSSHGDADLLVQTPPNTRNAENRRVEVIVR